MNQNEKTGTELEKKTDSNKKSFSDIASGVVKANDYKNEFDKNGFTGLASKYAKDKISDKINSKINNKHKATSPNSPNTKKNLAGNNNNNSNNNSTNNQKNSVNSKKNEVKNKNEMLKNKKNNNNATSNEPKAEIKKQINEIAFKKGVALVADTFAAGTGEIAEKALETKKAEKAVEAARNASNPVSAVKEGTKQLIKIVIIENYKRYLLYMLPLLAVIVAFFTIILSLSSNYSNSYSYFDENENNDLSIIDSDYKSFFENIEKYGGSNKKMVISVLTAYKDNDEYSDEDSNKLETYSCTDEELENGECFAEERDGITKYSKAKMKKYIKKVSNKIDDSSDGIDEGDYKDRTTGSEFFWWLYDDFADDYYSEYLNKNSNTYEKKKKEIIETIYLLYKDLSSTKENNCSNDYYNTACPGVTISGVGFLELEDYVAGVVKREMGSYYNYPEVLKSFAIAARSFLIASGKCDKVVSNSQNFQTYSKVNENNSIDKKYIQAARDTAGLVVLKKPDKILQTSYVTVPVQKYITKNGDIWTFDMLHDASDSNSKYKYSMSYTEMAKIASLAGGIYYPSESSGHHWGMLSYGAVYEEKQGRTYDQILKTFYGQSSILAATGTSKVESSSSGLTCGYNGDGLTTNPDGFVSRTSRPQRNNPYFYNQKADTGANGWLEGECAWYASGRAQEILGTLKNGKTWSYNGNGGSYCTSRNYDKNKFVISNDYTKPQPGAVVSWASGSYGHVAIVEKVEGNNVTISQAGIGFGPKQKYLCSDKTCIWNKFSRGTLTRKQYCEADGSGCFNSKTMTISQLKNYSGSFQCYIYLAQPK